MQFHILNGLKSSVILLIISFGILFVNVNINITFPETSSYIIFDQKINIDPDHNWTLDRYDSN